MKKITTPKFIVGLVVAGVAATALPIPKTMPVYAEDDIVEVKLSPDGNWIHEGGMNRYSGDVMETKEEAQEAEARMRMDGYIELHELTDEQWAAFVDNEDTDWWFEDYLYAADDKKAEFYNDGWYKFYIFEPSFIDWWNSYLEVGESARSVDRIPQLEIQNSSVVIDYRTYWVAERIGTDCSDEINDGIPEWYDTGYICIESPIDAEIKLILNDEQTYYTVYVTAGIPFRAKMKYGNYHIVSINGVDMKEIDKAVPCDNVINIGWGDNLNLETPLELDIEKTVKAYNIPSADISGKPDRSLDQNQQIPKEEKVTLEEETEDTEDVIQTKPNWFKRILIGLIILIICAGAGAYIYLDRRRRR